MIGVLLWIESMGFATWGLSAWGRHRLRLEAERLRRAQIQAYVDALTRAVERAQRLSAAFQETGEALHRLWADYPKASGR